MYLLKIKNKIFATQEYLKKLTISLVWWLKIDRLLGAWTKAIPLFEGQIPYYTGTRINTF